MQLHLAAGSALEEGYSLGHMDGWSWVWMMTGWLSMIVVIALIVWAFQRGSVSSGAAAPTALDILAGRYARGDISAEEYEERRSVLEGR